MWMAVQGTGGGRGGRLSASVALALGEQETAAVLIRMATTKSGQESVGWAIASRDGR